jgi:hypothetical protein
MLLLNQPTQEINMEVSSLTDLANLYGSDKGTVGPAPEWRPHNYTDIYEAYLGDIRNSEVAILEIGLGVVGPRCEVAIVCGRNTGGASLKMWRDFFPNGKIVGIDINPCSYLDNERVRTYVVDQGSDAELTRFVDALGGMTFDVIVDDGSHRPDHQQIAFGILFKTLKAGGLYFVEDLLSNGLGDAPSERSSCDAVLNTRAVLKGFKRNGCFPEPNALGDTGYLAAHIGHLAFHAPRFCLDDGQLRYLPETEFLCAIRKKRSGS